MELVRSLWLMLCIDRHGIMSTSTAGAPAGKVGLPAGPARAPVLRAVSFFLLCLCFLRIGPAFASNSYYGPPYSGDVVAWGGNCTEQVGYGFPTISATVQANLAVEKNCGIGIFTVTGYSVNLGVNAPQNTYHAPQTVAGVTFNYLGGDTFDWIIFGSLYNFNPTKNLGAPCNCAGDPINIGTGNEYRDETDADLGALSLHRYYNSHAAVASSAIGAHWRHSFDRNLEYLSDGTTSTATVFRPDGLQVAFTLQNGQWTTDADVADRLTTQTNASGNITGFLYFDSSTRYQEAYDANGFLLSITNTQGQVTTLAYSTASTPTSIAPAAGLLLTVTDPRGRTLSFTYNAQGNVATITEPDGGSLGYAYDGSGNLQTVTYPDAKTHQYVYNESSLTGGTNLPNALTGDIDESNTRLTSIGYNSQGQATMSTLPSGADLTQVAYNSDGTTSVTYPTGSQTTLNFTVLNGSVHTSTSSTPCGPLCGQPNASATFDSNGYPASHTDFNGNVTNTTFDNYGLLHIEVDASGSPAQRTITTGWDDVNRVPLTRTVQSSTGSVLASTSWVYNTIGQPLARCEIDPAQASGYTCSNTGTVPAGVRRWVYTYCTAVDITQCPIVGLLLSVTGPRTDVTQTTTYAYYLTNGATSGCGTPGSGCHQAGDLQTVTDALGHVTTYASYDGAGRVTRITDPNGVNTDLTYTPRGWLASRSVGGSTTTFSYMPYGEVKTITDPDGYVTTFGYDTAHRLTDIYDAQNNDLHYALNAAGQKTGEQVITAAGSTVRSRTKNYNSLGQLTSVLDGLNQTVFSATFSDSYDANGNLVHSVDGKSYQQQQSFDALNRLTKTIANYNGSDTATANTTTTTSPDALDRVASITDPSGLVTSYTHDGLSNLTALQSPDSGTSTSAFDAAGNTLTHTDAKGVVATSTYDALDRKTSTSYTDTTANVSYFYDDANSVTGCAASAPLGRLTRIVEHAVSTTYCYDARGNVIQKMQAIAGTTDSTSYRYTAANRLNSETTPDGAVISYAYDSDGRINAVNVAPSGASTASTVISATTWLPFGPISSYTLGNGQTVTRTYDANYRATDITSPAFNLHLARDVMGNVSAIGPASGANPATETYAYDPLYRLGSVTEASGTTLESYTYNQTGDRLSKAASGLATGAYLYTTGTHQLKTIGNASQATDANGNTTGSVLGAATYGFAYNGRNRLSLAQLNGSTVGTYTYNALGQRIGKVTSTAERYGYNESNQLIAEYGATNRDYVWLGDLPVAVVDNTINGSVTTSVVNYVVADQLGTPRAVTNSAGTTIWQWAYQGNPFGEQAPTSSSGYVLNLRYPGQYYDAETGTNYNMFRTYEPATGRYLQSDSIGLAGGISTYAYVGSNPTIDMDPLGLSGVSHYRGVPPGSVSYQLPNGQTFYAPPSADFQAEMQAGQDAGMFNIPATNAAVGQFGTYDYQRTQTPDGPQFTAAYTDASNFGVGVYMYGAGYSLPETLAIGEAYAILKSSNPDSLQLAQWWSYGWNAANDNLLKPNPCPN